MAKDEEYVLRAGGMPEKELRYWWDELRQRGMTPQQLEILFGQPGLCAHDLCEQLDQGCPPEVAFDIHSA